MQDKVNDRVKAFYSSEAGDRLIADESFTPLIQLFLKNEFRYVKSYLQCNSQYNALLEIGCMDARNLEIAIELSINYYGLDGVAKYIDLANRKIQNIPLAIQASVHCLSANELTLKNTPVAEEEKPLCFIPFNAIGNMLRPQEVLQNLYTLGYDVLISTYLTHSLANQARYQYYLRCGYSGLKEFFSELGTLFTADTGLYSYAYDVDYFANLCRAVGFFVEIYRFSPIGVFYILTSADE